MRKYLTSRSGHNFDDSFDLVLSVIKCSGEFADKSIFVCYRPFCFLKFYFMFLLTNGWGVETEGDLPQRVEYFLAHRVYGYTVGQEVYTGIPGHDGRVSRGDYSTRV